MSKEAILYAAARVFRQKGYHGSSMADIAEAVGLQKASLYHHFTGKQEILFELLDKALEILASRMDRVMAMKIPADEKLRYAMREYLQTLSDQGDVVSVLLLEHRSLNHTFQNRHIPNRDRFESLWRELIQTGVEEGSFCVEDIPLAVRGILGVLNWTITWYQVDGKFTILQIADQFSNLFLNGIEVKKGGL
mgnify:CR=1 FL=1